MRAFLQSDQTIRDVLPAYGPLHHQHVLIWSFALQSLARRGCACSYVWARGVFLVWVFERVSRSNCFTEGCDRQEGKVFVDTCNVWNVCCSDGQAVGEERRGGSSYNISLWLLSVWVICSTQGGRKKESACKLIGDSWMRICNETGAEEHDRTCNTHLWHVKCVFRAHTQDRLTFWQLRWNGLLAMPVLIVIMPGF